jgi:predicted enzyme related to lactoylglutathione lyase
MNIRPESLCQIEIRVSDLEKSISFYRHVFGWEPVPAHFHDYVVLAVPESCSFGISLVPSRSESKDAGTGVNLFFKAEKPEDIVKAAVLHGGKKLPSRRMPGYGRVVQFADPDGQVFGIFLPDLPDA